jgi:hypothetical protein
LRVVSPFEVVTVVDYDTDKEDSHVLGKEEVILYIQNTVL